MITSTWSLEYLIGGWQPSFHDDHFIGWLTTGSYFGCAIMAALFATFLHGMEEKRARNLWCIISLIMVLLGINKQLALQMLFIGMGKQIALAQGWYDHRRIVQFSFVIIFTMIFTAAFLRFTRAYRDLFRQYALTFWGCCFF
jgi:hypothetical protein